MSKHILAALITLAFTAPAMAQHTFGAQLGYNIGSATVSDAPGVSVTGKGGVQVGGNYTYWFNKEWGFKTGLRYTARDFDAKTGAITVKFAYSTLDIPLNVAYAVNDDFTVFGGFKLGLLGGKSCTLDGIGGTCTANVKGSNFINVGAGYDFTEVGGGKLGGVFEYDYGMDNINDQAGSNAKYTVSGFVLGLTWNWKM